MPHHNIYHWTYNRHQALLLPPSRHMQNLPQWCKNKEITTPTQQEMKTMERRPKEYKATKFSAQNQMTTLQPDFDHTR